MQRKIKKLLALVLVLAMPLSCNTVVYAEESAQHIFSGDIQPTEQENADFWASLSEKEKKQINEKIEFANRLANTPTTRAAATKISLPGSFTMYQQETSYYCVPACVKSVLKYLTGKEYSQASIAKDLGTTTSGTQADRIAPYLNEKQGNPRYHYFRSESPTLDEMCRYTYAVVYSAVPGLMSIYNPTGRDWNYATYGHRLVINAVYSDKSKLQFADPLGQTEADWPYFYEKACSTVYPYCRDVIW